MVESIIWSGSRSGIVWLETTLYVLKIKEKSLQRQLEVIKGIKFVFSHAVLERGSTRVDFIIRYLKYWELELSKVSHLYREIYMYIFHFPTL